MTKHHNKLVRDKIPEIIEKACKTAYTHILSEEEYIAELDKKLGEEFAEYMRTDIVLKKKDTNKALIIDTKYYGKILTENYGKSIIRPEHLYQIFAYVKNMDKENTGNVSGLLLYAKTQDEVFPDGKPFVIGNNSIGAKTLDLNCEFEKIRQQLDDIAQSF